MRKKINLWFFGTGAEENIFDIRKRNHLGRWIK
jgi:hypothetical protein